jgi:ribosomal protein L29
MQLRDIYQKLFEEKGELLFTREESYKIAREINEEMRDVRRDIARKFFEAERDARNIILD